MAKSYIGEIVIKSKKTAELSGFFGATTQIRTGDLILTKDVLYQLSHSSVLSNDIDYIRFASECQEVLGKFFRFFENNVSPFFSIRYQREWADVFTVCFANIL